MSKKVCIGFGQKESCCQNELDSQYNLVWCPSCDAERIKSLDKQFDNLAKYFGLLVKKPSERIQEIYDSLYHVNSTDIDRVIIGIVARMQAITQYLDEQAEIMGEKDKLRASRKGV